MIDTSKEHAAALEEPPRLSELERMAEDVLDRRSAKYVEACFHFARFIRDHGRDAQKLAEAIERVKDAAPGERDWRLEEALVMVKGIAR
jgi:hypothetical protein